MCSFRVALYAVGHIVLLAIFFLSLSTHYLSFLVEHTPKRIFTFFLKEGHKSSSKTRVSNQLLFEHYVLLLSCLHQYPLQQSMNSEDIKPTSQIKQALYTNCRLRVTWLLSTKFCPLLGFVTFLHLFSLFFKDFQR